MLPKVVKHNGAHELFMNTYGRRRRWSMVLLASEASELSHVRVQLRFQVRTYICISYRPVSRSIVDI